MLLSKAPRKGLASDWGGWKGSGRSPGLWRFARLASFRSLSGQQRIRFYFSMEMKLYAMSGGLDHLSQNCEGGDSSPVCTLPTSSLPIRCPLSIVPLSHRGSCQVPATVLASVFPVDPPHLPKPHILFLSSLPLPFSIDLNLLLGKGLMTSFLLRYN